ncbi:MAG: esterase family protein [Bacteroidales bacterium]|nr:esterase family protein [Bacteroidales bacterium]MBQ9889054.1 esterase family protein [Bacteroidales bacterium]
MKTYAKILLAASLTFMSLPSFAGKVVTDSLRSSILGISVKCNVYLPDGFGKTGETYPVIYLLHGLTDTYTAWVEKGNMKPVVDELITSGECLPVVIVMPNAGGPNPVDTWNGYFNVPGRNYEDFFFKELIPWAEGKYKAGGSKGRRAIMGLSMGGGGSTVYCQRHPDMFSSCFAMSAWLDQDISGDKPSKAGDRLIPVRKSVHEHSAIRFMEEADEATLEKLRSLAWFIDCGDDDFLLDLNLKFYQLMRDKKVPAQLRVRNGVHNWEYWHYSIRTALPYACRNFTL